MNLENIDAEKWLELALEYGLKILGAIAIWIIGSWVIKNLLKSAKKVMTKGSYDESLKKFLLNLTNWTLKIILIIVVLGTVGVETTSFAAILAALGLAIGLALQGSLANFAGGVLILIIKPFKVGDFIKGQGIEGTVKEISIFNTKLATPGNQIAVIPNGKLSNDNIINFSEEGTRKENLIFGIGYDSDIKLAKDVLLNLVNEQKEALQIEGKKPMVVVSELGDSSVNLSLRYWANNEDFWNLRWLVLEEGKTRLETAGIEIPYPHQVEIQKQA
ncbi:mechanosensitive ion channel family protein [Mariniflexile sp. AS56]|uniref:mechanosensitive ion channel family protein n=1 Tax=Mariniflexile sp. AS56 TaxID=3063957 RepID=UPI0026ECCA84|nr:mechanosensitive ion channel domain-containing protein [Mariniflexile sp. AS56]MDO7172906.1 mechanosensitive ion channel [Mariniflexile sp. AS56]